MERNAKGQFVKGSNIHELSNQRFGQLVVVELAEIRGKRSFWLCRCDCGNKKIVRSDALISYKTVSCGCLKKKQDKINLTAHHKGNITFERLYHIWASMKQRCENPNSSAFKDYGGRGIRVCQGWSSDYMNFKEWAVKNGYADGLTIERKDVNGNYCPENCMWIAMKLQTRNTRRTFWFTIDGITKCFAEWAEIFDVSYATAYARYRRGIRDPSEIFYSGNLSYR